MHSWVGFALQMLFKFVFPGEKQRLDRNDRAQIKTESTISLKSRSSWTTLAYQYHLKLLSIKSTKFPKMINSNELNELREVKLSLNTHRDDFANEFANLKVLI
ncbi:unnamed protein product [Ambrosiozyma monospora]|uniref:Unnamed protein product n=1 Tax=Ambrosiozyma monospora TaxID=43982 RepID=A0ACB5TT92_AMBMO|nr:unnamed protein product [Ambrosiozyma monospora]